MKRLCLILALVVLVLPVGAQSADELFQQAQRLERVNGDYDGAIALYRKVASDRTAPRTLVADALINMGQAYESLGRNEALSAYRRVLSEFADLSDQARFARERVAVIEVPVAFGPKPGDVTVIPWVQYENNYPAYYGVDMSPDGNLLAFIGATSIIVRNLETDEIKEYRPDRDDCGTSTLRFSPSGEWVAYGCFRNGSVGVINLTTGEPRTVFDGFEYFGIEYPLGTVETEVFDWDLTGTSIILSAQGYDRSETNRSDDRNQILKQPIVGGGPEIIEAKYRDGDYIFWENNGCMMLDDTVFFGDWVKLNPDKDSDDFIQWSKAGSDERGIAVFKEGVDYYLAGCDKANNLLYYTVSFPTGDTELWGASVMPNGSLIGNVKLMTLDKDINNWFHPFTQNGNLYFNKQGSGWGSTWTGFLDEGIVRNLKKLDYDRLIGWTQDGKYLVRYSGTGARLIDEASNIRRNISLDIPAGRSARLASKADKIAVAYWPLVKNPTPITRTWILDLSDGSVVDSLDGIAASAVSPDADKVYYTEIIDDRACVLEYEFAANSHRTVLCGSEAIGFPQAPIEMSASGKHMFLMYTLPDSSFAGVFASRQEDGTYQAFKEIDSTGKRPRFYPDDSGALIGSQDDPKMWDFETDEMTDFVAGLPDGYWLSTGITFVFHPDGRRFVTHVTVPSSEDDNLYVIHDVRSLMLEGKEPE